jgi:hypothetical protein
MRLASSVIAVLLIGSGCGNKAPAGDDSMSDGGAGDDGGGGGGDDGGHNGQQPTNVMLTMNHRPTHAAMYSFLVAYRDGGGAWALAPAPTGDVYTLPIHSPAYSVAWTCIGAGGVTSQLRQVSELQFAISERTALSVDVPPRCTDAISTVQLKGTISNSGPATTYIIKFGDRTAIANQQNQFTILTPPGTHDLVVLSTGSINIGTDTVVSSAYVQRDLTVAGTTNVMVDANNLEAVQSFDVNLLTGGVRDSTATILYANGTTAQLVADATPFYETESLADDQTTASDVYDQQMTVASQGSSVSSSLATVTPDVLEWAAVPDLGAITMTAVTTPYPRVTSTWTSYANAIGYTWLGSQTPLSSGNNPCGSGTCSIAWSAQLSAGVIGATGSYTMPDLSGLAGWNPALQMVAGTKVSGGVQAMTSSGTGDFPPLVPPVVGTSRTFATGELSVTP